MRHTSGMCLCRNRWLIIEFQKFVYLYMHGVCVRRRRSRSHSRGRRKGDDSLMSKSMLMSTDEAMVLVHGEMATIRDGDVTHQCIQTNLADVICGGK